MSSDPRTLIQIGPRIFVNLDNVTAYYEDHRGEFSGVMRVDVAGGETFTVEPRFIAHFENHWLLSRPPQDAGLLGPVSLAVLETFHYLSLNERIRVRPFYIEQLRSLGVQDPESAL